MFADDQAEAVPLSNVSMSALESHYARSALHSGWISANGPYVRQFERLLSLQTGTEHVIAMSSGTSALELALRALGIGSGHEVIIPALTFAAPASAVITVGATPVFADISAATWTLDPQSVALATSPKTRALIAVDIFGHPCDYDQLEQFGYPIIEDAAEAFGAEYKGRPAGSLGIVSVFSFHANKVTTTGEGGCVTTNDTDIADRVRLLNNHGMESDRPY